MSSYASSLVLSWILFVTAAYRDRTPSASSLVGCWADLWVHRWMT
jgi:hypothetical protein